MAAPAGVRRLYPAGAAVAVKSAVRSSKSSQWIADGTQYTEPTFTYTLVAPTSAGVIASVNNSDPLITTNQFGRGQVILTTPKYLQTSARDQILQGIKAGVYYYLTKPYEDQMLLAIVGAALQDAATKKKLREEVSKHRRVMGLMEQSRFRFRTLEEARNIAFLIANCFPEPEATVYGLNEMLINAVEHGNLGITYAEKMQLILGGRLYAEIDRRLALPANLNKWAYLSFEADENAIRVIIKDQGVGFDWRQYLDISPDRATHPNGRGIATSRLMSFNSVEYLGCGNEVICTVATIRHGDRDLY